MIHVPRPPREYKFNHVATRTASNLVSSDNLWAKASDVRRRRVVVVGGQCGSITTPPPRIALHTIWMSQNMYKGPPRGLESPRGKPYRCNGVPDLVLSSLNHVRARNRVAEQKEEKREVEEHGGRAPSRRRKKRDERECVALMGFLYTPFIPSLHVHIHSHCRIHSPPLSPWCLLHGIAVVFLHR